MLRSASVVIVAVVFRLATAGAEEPVDLQAIHRIRAEAFENSKVMEHAFQLTDVHGPRLSGSPALKAAGEWVVRQLAEYGIPGAKLEAWGPFGRGWSTTRFSAHLKEPQYAPLIGFSRPWSPGTNGPVAGDPIVAVIAKKEDFEKFKGKLKGRIVLVDEPRQLKLLTAPPGKRLSAQELEEQGLAPDPDDPSGGARASYPGARQAKPYDSEGIRRFRNERNKFLTDEGVAIAVYTGDTTDGGTVRSTLAGSWDPKDPEAPPSAALTPEHYNRLARLIERKVPVTVEFEMVNRFHDAAELFSVIAEIPGGKKKDEVVMLGAHMDSWTGGTGATDNASGSAVMIEALRILKALDLKMDRTVRLALWTGEEQGLLGSRAYVKKHFADPEVMKPMAEHARLAGYFNVDNGSGKIRGVYLQNNDMMRPIADAWLKPFSDLGAGTSTIRNTGSTDHVPFDEVGLPGFQFIQDPLEYSTRTHHTNMDVYDRLQAGDLMQASAVIASFVYHTANRADLLPRKPLPKPQPKKTAPAKETNETKPATAPSA